MDKFIDEVIIQVIAGHGGAGAVSFRHEKYVEFGGPDGGDGGKGGDVILQSTLSMQTLDKYTSQKIFKAGRGENGSGRNQAGKKGEDLILKVPVGTQVYDEESKELLYDFLHENEHFIIAKGGRGGKGNAFFKSSTLQTPRFAQEGEEGENKYLRLTLKLLADIGIVGLPNAGKSTLLSKITDAHPKIGNYAFTTLSPNLGVVKKENDSFRYTIADIPGIIEGASKGVGLGLSFLKHIERVKGIIYLFDITSIDILGEYKLLQEELKSYNKELLKKTSLLVLNKIDLINDLEYINEIKKLFPKKKIIEISAEKEINLQNLLKEIDKTFFKKQLKGKK